MNADMKLEMSVLNGTFAVHRCSPESPIPASVLTESIFAVLRSENELSILCSESVAVESDRVSRGWSCLRVDGTLDFELQGIAARISTLLANAEISIFFISSFDTDYVLVPQDRLSAAIAALLNGGIAVDSGNQS